MKNNVDISKLIIHSSVSIFHILVIAILLAIDMGEQVLLGQSLGAGVSELTEPGKAFKEYQAEAPPIKYISFEQSYAAGKRGPGVLGADGAIQPGGYFIRHLTNSPATTGILVNGASTNAEWEFCPEYADIVYGPRTFWTNYSGSSMFYGFLSLQTVARLGLPRAFPDHDDFVWISQTHFKFISPYNGNCEGNILKFDSRDRPTEIEYHSIQKRLNSSIESSIFYQYESDKEFPPTRFVVDSKMNDTRWLTTNTIHTLAIGTDEHAGSGYLLQEFLPTTVKFGTIYYLSNNTRYTLQTDGSIV